MVTPRAAHAVPASTPLTLLANDGLRLAAEHFPGAGPTLVLAHGFGQTRQAWRSTQQRLADAGRASLAWDVRGHGESQFNPPQVRYRGPQLVDDLGTAAAAAGERPILVGASIGGLTGLLAQSRSRPFSALVLVDITPRWEAAGLERILGFMSAHPGGFDSYEHAAEQIAAYLPHRREKKTPQQLAHLLVRRADGRYGWHWDPRLLSEFIPDSAGLQEQIEDACRALDVPTLLVSGGQSDLVTADTIAHFLDLAPHASHVQLPRATHMVAGDDNSAFTDTLLHFLSALATPTAAHGARP